MRNALLLILLLAAARSLPARGGAEAGAEAAMRPDPLIRQDILARLAWDERVGAVHLDAIVYGGRVILLGSVATAAGREAAEAGARDLAGVRAVDNRLEVRPRPAAASDETIRRQLRMMLGWLPDPQEHADVTIYVADGEVLLQGQVDSLWKKERLGQIAALPAGVARVSNELAVAPPDAGDDERIAGAIRAELARAAPEAADITVVVAAGRVILAGTVPSAAARRAAREAVLFSRGVVALDDRLLISGRPERRTAAGRR